MKKMMTMLLSVVLMLSVVACGGTTAGTNNVGQAGNEAGQENVSQDNSGNTNQSGTVEISAEMLEALGLSEEQWAAMDPAKQEAIAAEMSAVLEQNSNQDQKEEQETKTASQKYTPDDVMAGGNYTVVLGDYMNSITLYYENGKLVKIVEKFQKNDEEEEESVTYEGDSLAEYGFNFIDWDNASLQEILDGMKDYGGFGEYRIKKSE